MILAAGRGSRMKPLTNHTHKGLLKVAGKPLIEYHVEKLARLQIKDIVINISYLAKQIQNYLGDGKKYGVTIHYSYEDQPLEVGGGLIKALPLLGDGLFYVINCDVWCDYPLENLTLDTNHASGKILLVKNPDHNQIGDFTLDKQLVCPTKDAVQSYTYAGIALYHPKLFTGFEKNKVQPMLPILVKAMEEKKLQGEIYDGNWCDVGTPERLAMLM